MEEQFKETGFDYSRVIKRPSDAIIYPDAVADFLAKLNTYLQKITEEEWNTIVKEELSAVEELVEVAEKEEVGINRLEQIVTEVRVIQESVVPKIEKLVGEISYEIEHQRPE